MMKSKLSILAALLLLVVTGCNNDEVLIDTIHDGKAPFTLTATMPAINL